MTLLIPSQLLKSSHNFTDTGQTYKVQSWLYWYRPNFQSPVQSQLYRYRPEFLSPVMTLLIPAQLLKASHNFTNTGQTFKVQSWLYRYRPNSRPDTVGTASCLQFNVKFDSWTPVRLILLAASSNMHWWAMFYWIDSLPPFSLHQINNTTTPKITHRLFISWTRSTKRKTNTGYKSAIQMASPSSLFFVPFKWKL